MSHGIPGAQAKIQSNLPERRKRRRDSEGPRTRIPSETLPSRRGDAGYFLPRQRSLSGERERLPETGGGSSAEPLLDAADPPGQLHVLREEGDAAGMQGEKIGVLEEMDQKRFCGLL